MDLSTLNNEQLLKNSNRAVLRDFLVWWSQQPKSDIQVENWLNSKVRFGIPGEGIMEFTNK